MLKFFVPGPLPGMNEIVAAAKGAGGRGYAYAAMKKAWTEKCAWCIRAARIRGPFARVRLEFLWLEKPGGRGRDPDNVEAGQKFVWDSLVVTGVLANDGRQQNAGSTHTHELGSVPGVWVTILPC